MPRRRLKSLAAQKTMVNDGVAPRRRLLLRSFTQLVLRDQGFESRGALAAQINLPRARYSGRRGGAWRFSIACSNTCTRCRGATVAGVVPTTMRTVSHQGALDSVPPLMLFHPADPFPFPPRPSTW
jgi:hypothetical protein